MFAFNTYSKNVSTRWEFVYEKKEGTTAQEPYGY